MNYEINDLHHKLVINLTTDSTNTSNMYVRVYINDNTTPQSTTYVYNDGKFTIPHSDFTIGDTITKMEIVQSGNTPLWKTHEGVQVLVNGNITDTTINDNGTFNLTFDKSGAYDIQAVYLGNNSNQMAKTTKEHFEIKQPETISGDPQNDGQYNIKFVNNTVPSLTFKDKKTIQYVLTKGGVPIDGKTVNVVNPTGANSTQTSKNGGLTEWQNNNWACGKYKLGALFYDPSTHKVITSTFKTVEIKKGTPTWTDNAGNSTTFYVGGIYKATLKYRGSPLTKQKIDLYVNGKKTTTTTSNYGVATHTFKSKGTFDLKFVYKGSNNLNQAEISKKITVVVE